MANGSVLAHPETLNGASTKIGRLAFFKHGKKRQQKIPESCSDQSGSKSPHAEGQLGSLLSLGGVFNSVSDSDIETDFAHLNTAIEWHVQKYYQKGQGREVNQFVIEHATTGLSISWLSVLSLLSHEKTRLRSIRLCIAWTLFSRSLLLKLGLSSSPGSSFLPPEIVECFQSFSTMISSAMSGRTDVQEAHFALLSRWKQISATLMHSAYVRDAFSHFDSRAVNIERAINDLDPLLRVYADDSKPVTEERLGDLRNILRDGAKFAFLLFSQPYFWQFDWQSELADYLSENPVVFPSLLRVMDGDGKRLVEPVVLGKKRFLKDE